MTIVEIKTGPSKGKYPENDKSVLTLSFSDTHMKVQVGDDSLKSNLVLVQLWSHTVYELDRLAASLRYVAEGKLPDYYEVPSPKMLFGPTVGVRPVLESEVGHPGIGEEGDRVLVYCSRDINPLVKRPLVEISAVGAKCRCQASFEIEDVIRIADEIYNLAKALADKFVSWETDID